MQFDRNKFAEELGSPFLLKAADGGTVDVELIEVTEVKERPHQQSFSMLFRVPDNYSVEQGLYEIEHERLGAMLLFLVPIVPPADGKVLEAVINQLRDAGSDVSE